MFITFSYFIIKSGDPIYCVSREVSSAMPLTGFDLRLPCRRYSIQIRTRAEAVPPGPPELVCWASPFLFFFPFSKVITFNVFTIVAVWDFSIF